MERRAFIKTSCSLCLLFSTGVVMSTLSSCSPALVYNTTITENKLLVPLSLFEKNELQIVRVQNYSYDIAVRKDNNESFTALLMRCTHADNQLISTGDGFNCNLHGSIFEKDGSVIKGPAEIPLKKLITEIEADHLIIYLS